MVFPIAGGTQSDAYEIGNSLRIVPAASAYLSRTPGSEGNRRTFTISGWVKRSNPNTSSVIFGAGHTSAQNMFQLLFQNDGGSNSIIVQDRVSNTNNLNLVTERKFADNAAWYNFVLAVDTTQGTASNRVKLYVNGTQETSFSTETYMDQNYDTHVNDDVAQHVGAQSKGGVGDHFDGYLADFNLVDGTALDPSYFGKTDTNGIWIPKKPSVASYGTNGIFLEFGSGTGTSANSSGIGADTSGNDNHFAANNMGATEITTDTPTNNFATLDFNTTGSAQPVLRHGNTQQYSHGTANSAAVAATIMPDAGKWYIELQLESPSGGDYPFFGITDNLNLNQQDGSSAGDNGSKMAAGFEIDGVTNNQSTTLLGTITNTNTGWPSFSDGDIVQFALDLDNRKLWIGRNGTYINSGDPANGTNQQLSWTLSTQVSVVMLGYDGGGGGGAQSKWNYGNPAFSISSSNADANGFGNFEYGVPSGYFALCTKNLAEIS